jgi:hypothetical protein
MAYVPKDVEWFLADIVQEIRVAGSKRNIVHINYVLVRASSPNEAYAKAMKLGKQSALSYENPEGRKVTITFRGLGNLDVVYDPLEHVCEIMFREKLGVTEKSIKKLVRRKPGLEVFQPIRGRRGRPNYSSKEIMEEVAKRLARKK